MIPPLLLDVKPEHRVSQGQHQAKINAHLSAMSCLTGSPLPSWQVLDMCAAPGSKTAQLIELMDADAGTGEFSEDATFCYVCLAKEKECDSWKNFYHGLGRTIRANLYLVLRVVKLCGVYFFFFC